METLTPQKTVRLLCMSDIHCEFDRFAVGRMPNADICVIAGDFTNYGFRHGIGEVHEARKWMVALAAQYPKVLYVCGNHDFGMDNATFSTLPPSAGSIKGIERATAEYMGLTFRGASLSTCFDAPALAQEWCRMTGDRGIDSAEWDGLPYADVIVSHSPPYQMLDHAGRVMRQQRETGAFQWEPLNLGSPGLQRYIKQQCPRLVICGHVHEAIGVHRVKTARWGTFVVHSVGEIVEGALVATPVDGSIDVETRETMVINCARSGFLVTITGDRIETQRVGLLGL